MIKAIVFDCFGVLVTEGWLAFKDEHFTDNPTSFQEASELNQQADAGVITRQEFVEKVASLADVPAETVVRVLTNNAPNERLFEYISELKESYKIGLLSNASANRLDSLFTPAQIELFDATVLSVESGFIKPSQQAYEAIARQLNVGLDETIFIDDQERHCTGAREAGMQAIVYTNVGQLKNDLTELLVC